MEPRLFNLDPQLLHDAVLLAIAVFVMFLFLSYMLFNPAREMLKKRQDKVKNDIDSAEKSREDAAKLKEEYENRLREIHKEEDAILSAARHANSTSFKKKDSGSTFGKGKTGDQYSSGGGICRYSGQLRGKCRF